jgi:hypothetical protein
MITILFHCIAIRMQRLCHKGVTTATHIVTLNSSGFRGILNSKYDLVIIHFHAKKEMYLIVHKSLSCELKIYHVVTCMNRVCCACYTVISVVCIFRLCRNLKTNFFIYNVL